MTQQRPHRNQSGVVLDYTTVISGQPGYTFNSDQTYLVSGTVNLSGVTTFQGGAIVKFTGYGSLVLDPSSAAPDGNPGTVWPVSVDQPALFTSVDDNSVGQAIGSGTPAVNNAAYLDFEYGSWAADTWYWKNIVVKYAGCAIKDDSGGGSPSMVVSDAQFLNCNVALATAASSVQLNNDLFSGCTIIGVSEVGTDFNGAQITADQCGSFSCDPFENGNTVELVNSLLTEVADFTTAPGGAGYYGELSLQNCVVAGGNIPYNENIGTSAAYSFSLTVPSCLEDFFGGAMYGRPTAIMSSDSSSVEGSQTGVYQTGNKAHYYLATSSPYRNVGTTGIDSGLLAEIQTMTTYTPQDGGYPDNDGQLDLGYHYSVNEDSDFNGLADSWELYYFGMFGLNPTNTDSQGRTLLYDYQHDLDPSVVAFSLKFTNDYVNAGPVTGSIEIAGGTPYSIALLVNNPNTNNAIWQTYTSTNVVVDLNSGNGVYTILVGLRGLPSNGQQTWLQARVTLNSTPLTLTVTNPAGSIISAPLVQVQGYASGDLTSLTFDVSNALEIITNQSGVVTGKFDDADLSKFTINDFQCYDVALTNGLNIITVHATDVFGQIATTNCYITLDYSGDTTPPALNVVWPPNGAYISGDSFTFQGRVDDATATVTAQIVDANNNTNTVQGLVERDGTVSIGGLPVSAGANSLTVTATNAAGHSTTTNLTLNRSDVTVTLDPISSDQANQPSVDVTGTISDTSDDIGIYVNGVEASYLDGAGNWKAYAVPVSATGTATFDVELVTSDPISVGPQIFTQVQPPLVTLAYFTQDSGRTYIYGYDRHTVQWFYANGGSWDEDYYYDGPVYSVDPPIPPDGTNYTAPVVTSDHGETFSPTWQNAQITFDDYGMTYSSSIRSTPMIVQPGPRLSQVLKTYNVRVCAMSFSAEYQNYGGDRGFYDQLLTANNLGDAPMPPEQLAINGTPLVSSGVVNDDGSVWGTNSVTAMAGTLIPLRVTTTGGNYDYTFHLEIIKDKLYWQNMVQAEIDTDSGVVIENYLAGNGFTNNRANFKAVYTFYQKLFEEQPAEYYWMGLGRLAGSPLYAGLSDAEYFKNGLTVSGANVIGLDAELFQQTLIGMSISVYNDVAWQFEAYHRGGLNALEAINAMDNNALSITAWRILDEGIQHDDDNEIQSGNTLIAQWEQNVVLRQGYIDLGDLPFVVPLMSDLAQNPIFGGPSFSSLEPGQSISDYDYRWDWISRSYTSPSNTGVMPLWFNETATSRMTDAQMPLLYRAEQFSYVYEWTQLPPY